MIHDICVVIHILFTCVQSTITLMYHVCKNINFNESFFNNKIKVINKLYFQKT